MTFGPPDSGSNAYVAHNQHAFGPNHLQGTGFAPSHSALAAYAAHGLDHNWPSQQRSGTQNGDGDREVGSPCNPGSLARAAAPPAVAPRPAGPLCGTELLAASTSAPRRKPRTGDVLPGSLRALGAPDWARKARSGDRLSQAEARAIVKHVQRQELVGAVVIAEAVRRPVSRRSPKDIAERCRAVYRLARRAIGRVVGIAGVLAGLRSIGWPAGFWERKEAERAARRREQNRLAQRRRKARKREKARLEAEQNGAEKKNCAPEGESAREVRRGGKKNRRNT